MTSNIDYNSNKLLVRKHDTNTPKQKRVVREAVRSASGVTSFSHCCLSERRASADITYDKSVNIFGVFSTVCSRHCVHAPAAAAAVRIMCQNKLGLGLNPTVNGYEDFGNK